MPVVKADLLGEEGDKTTPLNRGKDERAVEKVNCHQF